MRQYAILNKATGRLLVLDFNLFITTERYSNSDSADFSADVYDSEFGGLVLVHTDKEVLEKLARGEAVSIEPGGRTCEATLYSKKMDLAVIELGVVGVA